jgi:hypothetical protein
MSAPDKILRKKDLDSIFINKLAANFAANS